MSDFRTKETHEVYKTHIKENDLESDCPLCKTVALKEFRYWRIIKNKFPYDRITKVHDMIVPKRHMTEKALTGEEMEELYALKNAYLNENYSFILESLPSQKSIPNHFHLHLLVPKDKI